jgi:hypothetical protein
MVKEKWPIHLLSFILCQSSDGIGVAFESIFGSIPFARTNFATKQAIVVLGIVGQELMSKLLLSISWYQASITQYWPPKIDS